MCSVGQLSAGAYFLRRNFYPSIVSVRVRARRSDLPTEFLFQKLVKSPETEQFTFEAVLFLAILANYHKSDAARLNPYLKRIRECTDGDFMRKLCWASNFALQTAIKCVLIGYTGHLTESHFSAYQGVSDDSTTSTLTSSLGSVVTRLRPDRVLALTTLFAPQNQFKDQ